MREAKRQGMTCPLGTNKDTEVEEVISQCWEYYYDKDFKNLESEMEKLRKLNRSEYSNVRYEMESDIDAENY